MILDQFKLDGKVALVTGADQGLGQGMAIALAEAGASIVGLNRGKSDQTAEIISALGHRFLHIQCDLSTASAQKLNEIIAHVDQEMGPVDILVNNAGMIRRAPALDFSEEDWDDIQHTNLRSAFFLAQAAARSMITRQQGKIINVVSMLSFQGGILVPAYTAAKSGLAGITRALANEWASRGINVNAIAPGYMATDNTAPLRSNPQRAPTILERIPAGRWGTPDDLKGTVVFLASSASDYLHGAIITVDGGWLCR